MKKFLMYVSAALTAILAVACTQTGTPSIELERETVEIDAEGGVRTVKVACDEPTRTTIEYHQGNGWIFLLPTYLKAGGGTLEFRINRYTGTAENRTATATVRCGEVEKTIEITQEHKIITDLEVSMESISADVEGGTYEIEVFCGFPWTAVADADWFIMENAAGEGAGKFTVKIPESTDYQYKKATITVSTPTLQRTIAVEHVGTRIGDIVWANANVNEPETFGRNCEVRGLLYQYNSNIGYPSYSADDHGDTETVVPGFETGAYDTMSETWKEENDPCPAGWRVPTKAELENLLGVDAGGEPRFWFDFYKANGMSVAGAYVGKDRVLLQEECGKGHLNGAIFIPQGGMINRDSGKQEDWWDAALWSATNVGQTWDMFGLWMNGNQDYGFAWYGSRSGLSVRCVWAQ